MPTADSPDSVESRVLQLFAEWTDRRDSGDPVSVDDLCPDDPEVRERLRKRLAAVEGLDRLFGGSGAIETPPPVVPPPGFVVQAELGRGAMGVVLRATQQPLGREVALKLVAGGRFHSLQELLRFQVEAQAAAAVTHPNVVELHEFGRHGGHPFLVMEFCPGGTLAERLKGGPLPPAEAAVLVAKLADGVQAAHERGVIHRDLKPGNVLFAADGTPKVADFGLAKTGESELTHTGAVVGSPAYMSPEQAGGGGRFAGPPADVWALGVILYECLTGTRPFEAESSWAVLDKVRTAEPPSARSRVPGVPRDLERVCLKCLRKEPHERYQSASELAADLRAWLDGRPVTARPVPAAVRMWKWVRRNPLPTAAVAAVVIAAAAGVYALDADRRAANATALTAQADRDLETERANRAEADRKAAFEEYRLGSQLFAAEGAVSKSLELSEQAERAGVQLTPELRLERVRAYYAVSRYDRARAELRQLEAEPLAPELAAQVQLLLGDFAVGVDDAEAARRIKLAVAGPLPPADRAYADALQASATPAAVRHLESAIALNPRHVAARTLLSFSLMTLGRLEEANRRSAESRLLFPEHPHFPVIQAMSCALLGDTAGVESALASRVLADAFPGGGFADFAQACRLFPLMNGEFLSSVYGDDSLRHPDAARLLAAGDTRKLAAALQTTLVHPLAGEVPFLHAPLPPSCRPAFEKIRDILTALIENLSANRQPGVILPPDQVDELGKALKSHPEGLASYLYAFALLERANGYQARNPGVPGAGDRYRALLAEAGRAAMEAARTPSILPATRRIALDQAMLCYGLAGKPVWASVNMEWAKSAAKAARQQMEVGPIHLGKIEIAVKVARNAEDWTLARTLLDDWEKRSPGNPSALRLRAEVEFQAQSHATALAAAEQFLRQQPADERMLDITNDCRRVFGKPLLAPPPKPVKK